MLEKPLTDACTDDLLMFEFDIGRRTWKEDIWRYPLDDAATAAADMLMTGRHSGLVIERDDSQGDLEGYKKVMRFWPEADGKYRLQTEAVVDLLDIADPHEISLPARIGDVGLGQRFAMPYWTIELIVFHGDDSILIGNDNNFPFSVGRHIGARQPDDSEIVEIRLPNF
jgi:glycerophosphoryl diester phosphodiesterase